MFTGIVQAVGTVRTIDSQSDGYRISIATPQDFLVDSNIGDSICVQGICLTATDIDNNIFKVDASNETLRCTTLGNKKINDQVNLETALTLATRLGGHLVTGHIDGLGKVTKLNKTADSMQLTVDSPKNLSKYIARKGSICIDGVSLTVNEVNNSEFEVTIIPHTFSNTTLSGCTKDMQVNLEVDLIARYIERLQSHSEY